MWSQPHPSIPPFSSVAAVCPSLIWLCWSCLCPSLLGIDHKCSALVFSHFPSFLCFLSLLPTCFTEDGQKGERRPVPCLLAACCLCPPAFCSAVPGLTLLLLPALLRSFPDSWSRSGAAWLGPSLSSPPSRPHWDSELCLLSTTTTRRQNSCWTPSGFTDCYSLLYEITCSLLASLLFSFTGTVLDFSAFSPASPHFGHLTFRPGPSQNLQSWSLCRWLITSPQLPDFSFLLFFFILWVLFACFMLLFTFSFHFQQFLILFPQSICVRGRLGQRLFPDWGSFVSCRFWSRWASTTWKTTSDSRWWTPSKPVWQNRRRSTPS